jgi:cytidine deaminase
LIRRAARGVKTGTAADEKRMIEAARAARSHAHAPYSHYAVGAAVLTRSGRVYAGCNVENATYGATLCAERSAVAAMVAAGDDTPIACAVVTAGPRPGAPCGICRQVLVEFARDMKIVLLAETGSGKIIAKKTTRLAKLLPSAFRLPASR